ncbi:hypothetical protein PR048_021780 [Dryococelus australis]|uniref:Uncharacterized protein n=1 Tax=Dryococelus australis TaxID=614101 RepID=A0ABQ9GZD6_9NEOP|nr:hypothetical protein PR048_021780 [Dryococelus australis]
MDEVFSYERSVGLSSAATNRNTRYLTAYRRCEILMRSTSVPSITVVFLRRRYPPSMTSASKLGRHCVCRRQLVGPAIFCAAFVADNGVECSDNRRGAVTSTYKARDSSYTRNTLSVDSAVEGVIVAYWNSGLPGLVAFFSAVFSSRTLASAGRCSGTGRNPYIGPVTVHRRTCACTHSVPRLSITKPHFLSLPARETSNTCTLKSNFVIGSQFITHALDDSRPIADVPGNSCQLRATGLKESILPRVLQALVWGCLASVTAQVRGLRRNCKALRVISLLAGAPGLASAPGEHSCTVVQEEDPKTYVTVERHRQLWAAAGSWNSRATITRSMMTGTPDFHEKSSGIDGFQNILAPVDFHNLTVLIVTRLRFSSATSQTLCAGVVKAVHDRVIVGDMYKIHLCVHRLQVVVTRTNQVEGACIQPGTRGYCTSILIFLNVLAMWHGSALHHEASPGRKPAAETRPCRRLPVLCRGASQGQTWQQFHSSAYWSLSCVFKGCCLTPGSYGIRKVFPCKYAIGSEACRAGVINCDPTAKPRRGLWGVCASWQHRLGQGVRDVQFLGEPERGDARPIGIPPDTRSATRRLGGRERDLPLDVACWSCIRTRLTPRGTTHSPGWPSAARRLLVLAWPQSSRSVERLVDNNAMRDGAVGAAVVWWLDYLPPTKVNRWGPPGFSHVGIVNGHCPLVGGFSRGFPISIALSFRRCPIPRFNDSQDLDEHPYGARCETPITVMSQFPSRLHVIQDWFTVFTETDQSLLVNTEESGSRFEHISENCLVCVSRVRILFFSRKELFSNGGTCHPSPPILPVTRVAESVVLHRPGAELMKLFFVIEVRVRKGLLLGHLYPILDQSTFAHSLTGCARPASGYCVQRNVPCWQVGLPGAEWLTAASRHVASQCRHLLARAAAVHGGASDCFTSVFLDTLVLARPCGRWLARGRWRTHHCSLVHAGGATCHRTFMVTSNFSEALLKFYFRIFLLLMQTTFSECRKLHQMDNAPNSCALSAQLSGRHCAAAAVWKGNKLPEGRRCGRKWGEWEGEQLAGWRVRIGRSFSVMRLLGYGRGSARCGPHILATLPCYAVTLNCQWLMKRRRHRLILFLDITLCRQLAFIQAIGFQMCSFSREQPVEWKACVVVVSADHGRQLSAVEAIQEPTLHLSRNPCWNAAGLPLTGLQTCFLLFPSFAANRNFACRQTLTSSCLAGLLAGWVFIAISLHYAACIYACWVVSPYTRIQGRGWLRGKPAHLPPTRIGFNPRPGHLPDFRQVGIVTDDAAGRWASWRMSRFPAPLHSDAAPFSPHFTLIGSQDLVKEQPKISQHAPFNVFHLRIRASRWTLLSPRASLLASRLSLKLIQSATAGLEAKGACYTPLALTWKVRRTPSLAEKSECTPLTCLPAAISGGSSRESRGGKGDITTRFKYAIAAKCTASNRRRAVLSSHCVYLWDFPACLVTYSPTSASSANRVPFAKRTVTTQAQGTFLEIRAANQRMNTPTSSSSLVYSPPTKANRVLFPAGVPPPPGISNVEIVPDDTADRRVFSGMSHSSRPYIPTLPPYSHGFTLIAQSLGLFVAAVSPHGRCRVVTSRFLPIGVRRGSPEVDFLRRGQHESARPRRWRLLRASSHSIKRASGRCRFRVSPAKLHAVVCAVTVKAVHDEVSTFDINLGKRSLPLLAYISTGALSGMRPVKLVTMDRNRYGQCRNERAGKREIPEKTCRPTASSGTIPTCKHPE